MLPEGVVRTPMGLYVLRDDVYLSRVFERVNRLDTNENIIEISSFAHLIPEGGVIIDAGAFVGDHTITYSQIVGRDGAVFAFEPHPVAYQALHLNVARLSNVATFRAALSDRAEDLPFNPIDNAGGSFLLDGGSVSVAAVTLDEFLLPNLKRCDLIHLDAEGWEPRILRGARQLIAQFRPVMLVEMCDKHLRRAGSSEPELMAALVALGYTVTTIPSHLEPELRDVLCVPVATEGV